MSANQEEALRALEISARHESQSNYGAALRFARKSLALSPTLAQAKSAISRLEKLEASASSGSSSGVKPNASTAAPRASTSRAPPPEPEKREYTQAQVEVVKKVKSCKVTAYYDILGLERTCEEVHIKKSYRKLALTLHPDKCGAPGTEEAFKMVSKAFQVLSDSNKRAIYDETGGDPDSRGGGGGGGGGGTAGFAGRRGGMAGGGGEELSPEDLFQFFFGQGGASFGGGGFGGGRPAFQFYGPGGVNMGGGNGQRRRPQAAGQAGAQGQQSSAWLQIAPLLILFAFSLLTQLPSLFGSTPVPDPDFSWAPSSRFHVRRTTQPSHVDYYVNAAQFSQHPIYQDILDSNPSLGFKSSREVGSKAFQVDLTAHFLDNNPPKPNTEPVAVPAKVEDLSKKKFVVPNSLAKFEKGIERTWAVRLQGLCQNEISVRQERLERARGFFGIGADWDKVREVTNAKLEHCERLSEMGYTVNY